MLKFAKRNTRMINRKIKDNYREEAEGVSRGGRKGDQISLRFQHWKVITYLTKLNQT